MFSNVIGFEPNRGLEIEQIKLKNLHTNYQYYMLGLYDKDAEVEYHDVVNGPGLSSIKIEYISQHLDLSITDIKKYKIQKNISKLGHKDSRIRISNVDDLTKLVNYLYQDRLDIGLKRKYNKVASYVLTKDSY